MKQVIFIDVLLFENFILNYLLLYIINRFCRCRAKLWRIALGSIIGASYVMVMFFPGLRVLYSLIIKLMIPMVMIAIAFSPSDIRDFLKMLILFYLEAFIIAGCIICIFYLSKQEVGIYNGAALLNKMTANYMIVGSLAAIVMVKFGFDYFDNYHRGEKDRINIEIFINEKSCHLTALVDTGNSLKDPLTNVPVVVVYTKAILGILPDEILPGEAREDSLDYITENIPKSNLKSRLRLIPFKALGTDNGLLTGIRVDRIYIDIKSYKKVIDNVVIALYNKPLSSSGDYEALAYPEILN